MKKVTFFYLAFILLSCSSKHLINEDRTMSDKLMKRLERKTSKAETIHTDGIEYYDKVIHLNRWSHDSTGYYSTISFLPDSKFVYKIWLGEEEIARPWIKNTITRIGKYEKQGSSFKLYSDIDSIRPPGKLSIFYESQDTLDYLTITLTNEFNMPLHKKGEIIPFRFSAKNLVASKLDPNKNQTVYKTHHLHYNSQEIDFTTFEYLIKKEFLPIEINILSNYNNDTISKFVVSNPKFNYSYIINSQPDMCFKRDFYQNYPFEVHAKETQKNTLIIDSIWNFKSKSFFSDTLVLDTSHSYSFIPKDYNKRMRKWRKNSR